ncbi:MAG TPA: hypothetical protein VF238_06700, partial [Methylomirabilota bacterium]
MIEETWADPKSRPLLQKALKTKYPNAQIPELEVREAHEQTQAQITEREQKLEARMSKFEAEREHDLRIAELKAQRYTGDDIAAIEKIMAEEGIGLHQNAAIVYDSRRQVGSPRTPASEARTSMTPRAYGRGAYAPFFNGIMEGEFHHPGEEWARSTAD